MLRALRYVQWDLSFTVLRKRIPVWIHLLDVIGVGISFSASFRDSPIRPSLKHLNDGGSSDTAGSLTSELAGASDIWKRAVVDPN